MTYRPPAPLSFLGYIVLCVTLLSCAAKKDFRSAADIDSIVAYEKYVDLHPDTKFTPRAEARLATLREDRDWDLAAKSTSSASIAEFRKRHPASSREAQATTLFAERKQAEDWTSAVSNDTEAGFRNFLKAYPTSSHVVEANTLADAARDTEAFAKARTGNTAAAFASYLQDFPVGAYRDEARERQMVAADQEAYAKAKGDGSEAAYRAYLKQFPSGASVAEATSAAASAKEYETFSSAEKARDLDALRDFVRTYPSSRYSAQAHDAIKEREHAIANERATDIPGMKAYLASYPNGKHAASIRDRLHDLEVVESAFATADKTNTVVAYNEFVRKHPTSSRAYSAREAISRLEAAAEAAKRRRDTETWESAKRSRSISQVQRYLKSYPDGVYSDDAEELLVDLQVAKIMSGDHGVLPPAQRNSYNRSSSSMTAVDVENGTGYTLTVYYSGPTSRSLKLAPGASGSLSLQPGSYRVAASVSARNVRNYAGSDNLQGGSFEQKFYIQTTSSPSYNRW